MGSIDGEESMEVSSGHEEKIFVSVRVRPLNEKEIARNEVIDWECINENTIIYKNNFSPERSLYPTSYTFDRAFRPDCTTRQVYKEGAKAVVLSVVSGINSSVFAYGQTSSGKTYTMTGITEYTMQDIFEYIQKHKEREFQLKFSAMEIYNESVRDLLIANGGQLRLLDDPERGTVVEKLTEETLRDWNHFKDLLSVCEAQRQIGETFLNEASSRSHQILRLTIESSAREFSGKSNSGVLAATLNFVDLAGSERASQALSAGSRLKEGSHINRSLLSLGTVIRKLSKGRTGHVPYRDSKLTRILHSSLGGNARTAIICTLSPARSYVEQSRNTLVFASCAKEVMTNAQVNVVMTDKALVKQLQKELARLESELKSASPSVRTDTVALLREKDHQIEELERQVRELTMQLNLALSRTQDLHQGVGDDRNPTWEGQDSNYPKLHVRQASESSQSETFSMSDHHSIGPGSRVTEKSISPDRHSRSSYSENYILSSEFEEDLPPTSPFERMFIETPSDASPMMLFETSNSAKTDYYCVSKRNTEWTPDSIEILPYQVSEVKGDQTPGFVDFDPYQVSVSEGLHEETPNSTKFDPYHVFDANGGQTPNYVESYPYRVHKTFEGQTSHTVEFDPYHEPEGSRHNSRIDPREVSDSEAMRDQYDENLEDFCKEVQCIESEESMANNVKSSSLSSEGNKEAFPVTGHGNSQTTDQEAVISSVRQNGELGHGEPSIWGHSPEDSTWQEKDSVSECKKIDAIESKGCDTVISTSSSYQEKVVKCEAKDETEDPIASQREFIVELDDIQKKLHALRSDEDGEILSGRALQNSVGMATLDEIQTPNREVSCDIEIRNSGTPVTEIKEMTQFPHKEQLSDSNVGDTLQKTNTPVKNVKDVGLNPPEDVDSCMWPTDFKKLQREIIDLWHACHVSLVHRTSFFLLFVKGDPTDIVYMEVERRRLSFLKDAFSSGNSTILDGRQLNPDSSKRRLHLEREMLSKLIKKRLSIQERNHLYVKWGINIDTKKRCSQLAHRLWTEPNDMDHIVKSANLVAKLVKFTDPPVPKEMLGLNLMPSQQVRKSHWWIPSPRGLI